MKDEAMMRIEGRMRRAIGAKKEKSVFSMLVFLFFILHPSSLILSSTSARAVVRVKTESIARSDHLTLGDIALVETNDKLLRETLRSIELGYAPNVGAVREITKQKIALAISAAGFSPGVVGLEGPGIALVRRQSQQVDATLLKTAVERAALLNLQNGGANARLSRLDLPAKIEVPTGTLETRASCGGIRNLFLPFAVSIELRVDGRLVKRLSTTAQVEAFAPVLVAVRDLTERKRLREGDYEIKAVRLDRDPSLYVTEASRLRGVALARSLARGEAITTDLLVQEIVVKPGDSVHIVGESDSVSLTVVGEARAAGRVGDRIQVKNLQSGMLFQAVIVDEGIVSVRF